MHDDPRPGFNALRDKMLNHVTLHRDAKPEDLAHGLANIGLEVLSAALAAPKADGWQQELEVDSYTYDARGHAFNIMQAQQRDGSTRWKVSDGIAVLNIHGEWEFEPSPSTRDDGFLARCRFDSPQSALAVLKRSLAPTSPAPQEESK